MPILRSIAWSLLALAFLIFVGSLIIGVIFLTIDVLFIPSFRIYVILILVWPLALFPMFNILSFFFLFAWWSFLAGFSILILNYVIKLFYRKKKAPRILMTELPYLMENPKIMAIIPAYNEEKSIRWVIEGTKKHVTEVLVLNDGSIDNTATIAADAGARVISNDYQMGLGITMKKAFKNALRLDADIVITIDADGQYDPEEIPKLLQPILSNEADLVLGSRFMEKGSIEKMSKVKKIGNKVFTWATNRFTGLHLTDSATGFRAFRKEVLKEIPITS
ncbi:MAG: glycosyltransferase family 2 protein, partial [Candidatus Helarchaeales archaeon]